MGKGTGAGVLKLARNSWNSKPVQICVRSVWEVFPKIIAARLLRTGEREILMPQLTLNAPLVSEVKSTRTSCTRCAHLSYWERISISTLYHGATCIRPHRHSGKPRVGNSAWWRRRAWSGHLWRITEATQSFGTMLQVRLDEKRDASFKR